MPYSLTCRSSFPFDKVCAISPVTMRVNWVNVGLPFAASPCTVCQKDPLNPTQQNFPVHTEDPVKEGKKNDIFHIVRIDLDLGAKDEQKAARSVWMQNSCLISEKNGSEVLASSLALSSKTQVPAACTAKGAEIHPHAVDSEIKLGKQKCSVVL